MTIGTKVSVERREFVLIFLLASIQFIHILDFVIMMPMGPSLMDQFQISPKAFGKLVSSYNFSAAAMGILYSLVADQYDRKKLLIIMMTGFTIGTFFCGLAETSSQMMWARIGTGAFGGVLNSLVFAIVADLITFERRGKALGIVMSSFSIASVLGVPLGLAISDEFGTAYPFYAIGILSIIITVITWFVLPSLVSNCRQVNVKTVLLNLKRNLLKPDHMMAYALIMSISMSMFLLIPFLAPYAVKNVGIPKEYLKYMYLVGGLCTVFTARLFGVLTDKKGPLKMFMLLTSLAIIPILGYTHAPRMAFPYLLMLSACFMMLVSGRMIPGMTLITSVPTAEARGSFMAILNSLRAVGSATSTFIGGLIISEGVDGTLVNFNRAGYFSVAIIMLSLVLATIVNKQRLAK